MPMLKDPRWAAVNFDGTPAAGALMYVYESGTDILAKVYSNAALNIVQENPIVANGFGYFPVPYLATGAYKVVITTADGLPLDYIESVSVD